jgi:hypothetical protein
MQDSPPEESINTEIEGSFANTFHYAPPNERASRAAANSTKFETLEKICGSKEVFKLPDETMNKSRVLEDTEEYSSAQLSDVSAQSK